MMSERGKLVVVSGPSGVGKSTIVRQVLRRTGADWSVSATTRAPRPGEVDGRDYRFVDRETFRELIESGRMLEHAEVFGDWYGTPAGPVERAVREGRAIVLDIDVQGAVQVHRRMPDATFVLIVPPSDAELERRLRSRGTEVPEALERRLEKARREIADAEASGAYNHVVVNDDLARAVEEVVDIVKEQRTND